jgi:hypothetical protein
LAYVAYLNSVFPENLFNGDEECRDHMVFSKILKITGTSFSFGTCTLHVYPSQHKTLKGERLSISDIMTRTISYFLTVASLKLDIISST